jgi:hypothetical protein
MSQFHQESIITLLDTYGFDLESAQVETVAVTWLELYEVDDIVRAIVEAIYQHRYKARSVTNLLAMWKRNGRSSPLFTPEYERQILQKLPTVNSTNNLNLNAGLESLPPTTTRKPLPKPRTPAEPPTLPATSPEIVEEEPEPIDLTNYPPSDLPHLWQGQVVGTQHPSQPPPVHNQNQYRNIAAQNRQRRSPSAEPGDGLSDFYYKLKAIVEGSNSA